MNGYELAFIIDPDITEAEREKIVDQVKNLVTTSKAEPGELETWGKRDFTFPINKKTAGIYYLLYFTAPPESLADLERRMKINTNVMRYLITRQRKTKVKKLNRVAKLRPVER